MKLSHIEKRIPHTLTNSKDIIQKDREHARRSSRAGLTSGQENETWALYKKYPSWEAWGDLSGDRYIICPKPPSPAGKILDRRLIEGIVVPRVLQFARANPSSETQGQFVGSIKCSWWKFSVRSRRARLDLTENFHHFFILPTRLTAPGSLRMEQTPHTRLNLKG